MWWCFLKGMWKALRGRLLEFYDDFHPELKEKLKKSNSKYNSVFEYHWPKMATQCGCKKIVFKVTEKKVGILKIISLF